MFKETDLYIDLGTSNTLVFSGDKGVIFNEPSVIAENKYTEETVCVGSEAKELLGKSTADIAIIRPFKNGLNTIGSERLTSIIKGFIDKAIQFKFLDKYRIFCIVEDHLLESEKLTIKESFQAALPQKRRENVFIINSASFYSLQYRNNRSLFFVNMGSNLTSYSVSDESKLIYSNTINIGQNILVDTIVEYLRDKYKMAISEKVVEEKFLSVNSLDQEVIEQRARCLEIGIPKNFTIDKKEIETIIEEQVDKVIVFIKDSINKTPIVLDEIYHMGLILSGENIEILQESIDQRLVLPVKFLEKEKIDCSDYSTKLENKDYI